MMRSVVGQAVVVGEVFGGRPELPFIRTFCYMGALGRRWATLPL
jgi:hypothetical protein